MGLQPGVKNPGLLASPGEADESGCVARSAWEGAVGSATSPTFQVSISKVASE